MKYKKRICKWCGQEFSVPKSRKYNAVKYCGPHCKHEGYLDKHLKAQTSYKKRWQDLPKLEQRGYLLGEGQVMQHRVEDFEHEEQIIRKELRRIGLR